MMNDDDCMRQVIGLWSLVSAFVACVNAFGRVAIIDYSSLHILEEKVK